MNDREKADRAQADWHLETLKRDKLDGWDGKEPLEVFAVHLGHGPIRDLVLAGLAKQRISVEAVNVSLFRIYRKP